MVRAPMLMAALASVAFAAGCSKSESELAPVACRGSADSYLRALDAAPGEVRLEGDTPISHCLTQGQEGGELAEVGSTMITAATRLNAEARGDPEGPQTAQLGYLIGAAERGAEDTAGIHRDLILRLSAAARFSPTGPPSPQFRRAFARGQAAGRETG